MSRIDSIKDKPTLPTDAVETSIQCLSGQKGMANDSFTNGQEVEPSSSSKQPTDEVIGLACLDAARYGDIEDLEVLVKTYGQQHLAYRGGGGHTALHYACANGHSECVKWLIEKGGVHSSVNDSGNTPLHWAVQNQHLEVVKVLLCTLGNDADVLVRNAFGKSVLTEGFSGANHEILKLLLENQSANEEALMGGVASSTNANVKSPNEEALMGWVASSANANVKMGDMEAEGEGECQEGETEEEGGADEGGIIHQFVLDCNHEARVLQIKEREIKHADDPFGQEAIDDTTGLALWSASMVLARWLVSSRREILDGAVVCEIGAGCGLPGLATAVYSEPKEVFLTDLNPDTLANLRENIDLNRETFACPNTKVHALQTDWSDPATYPQTPIDVLIGSDLVYQKSIAPLLSQVIDRLLLPGSRFLYVAPDTGRDGLPEFLGGLERNLCLKKTIDLPAAKEVYCEVNPFLSQNWTEFVLHFHELASGEVQYKLYEYVKQA